MEWQMGGPRQSNHHWVSSDQEDPETLTSPGSGTSNYELFKPVLFVGKIWGLVSWDLDIQTLRKGRRPGFWIRTFCGLYKIICIISIIYNLIHNLELISISRQSGNDVSNLISQASLVGYFIFKTSVAIACLLLEGRLKSFLKTIDKSVAFFKNKREKRRYWLIITACNACSVLAVGVYTVSSSDVRSAYAVDFAAVVDTIGTTLADFYASMIFTLAADFCSHCFKMNTKELSEVVTSATFPGTHRFNKLRMTYEETYQLASAFQTTFGPLVVIDFSFNTLYLCIRCYELFVLGQFFSVSFKIASWLYLLSSLCRIYVLTSAATRIAQTAASGLIPLHNAKTEQLTAAERFEIMLLTNKLSQSPIQISVWGFFTISKKLFTTVVSMTVTYLIILAQFHKESAVIPGQNSTLPVNATEAST